MAHAKQPIGERQFKEIWQKDILPKLTAYIDVDKIEDTAVKEAARLTSKELTHFLEKELPIQIYATSLAQEQGASKPGSVKYLNVVQRIGQTTTGRGFGKLVPFIVHLIQPAIVAMYQSHVEKSVDSFSTFVGFDIEKWFEDRTGIKLDSGDKKEVTKEEEKKVSIGSLSGTPAPSGLGT